MTTFAPDMIPLSRPWGWMLPKAVVAGKRMPGLISLMMESR